MASRRQIREALLKALYLRESRGFSIEDAFNEMEAIDLKLADQPVDPDALSLKPFGLGIEGEDRDYALNLGRKIINSSEDFNERIKGVLQNWDISRVARIDRLIMWIAIAEMSFMLDIPANISINEALELSKKYSSYRSASFINGVLDKVARNMGINMRDPSMLPVKKRGNI